jgi:hypothetical protein
MPRSKEYSNSTGVDITGTDSWRKLKELKALVNTIKHGEGDSADKLRKLRPDFFKLEPDVLTTDTLELHGAVLFEYFSLQAKESDLYDYITAAKNFWDEMPERAYTDTEKIINGFAKKKQS